MRVCEITIRIDGPPNWTDRKINDVCGIAEAGDLLDKLHEFVEQFFATSVVAESIKGLKIETSY